MKSLRKLLIDEINRRRRENADDELCHDADHWHHPTVAMMLRQAEEDAQGLGDGLADALAEMEEPLHSVLGAVDQFIRSLEPVVDFYCQ